MNKSNIFRSADFYMDVGDVLHLLIIDETGTAMTIDLQGDNNGVAPLAPTALAVTTITDSSFLANWYITQNTTGFYLDVATDIGFTSMVAGYNNKTITYVASSSVTGLNPVTPYYYRLRAYNSYGTSPNSNIITANTSNAYGPLYNWFAATYSVGGVSIAPAGWHVSLGFTDCASIMLHLDPGGTYGVNIAGGYMKEVGTTYWTTPNTGATNLSGFNGRGAGFRDETGAFSELKASMYFWAPNGFDGADMKGVAGLRFNISQFYSPVSGAGSVQMHKNSGISLRLVKDVTILPDGGTGTMTDYDGNVYGTICIGTVEIMSEPLRVRHYNNGTPIPLVTDNALWAADTTGAMCWYNNVAP